MLKLEYFFACDFAFLAKGEKQSVIGIFQRIGYPAENIPTPINPFIYQPGFYVVGRASGVEKGEYVLALKMESPSGQEVVLGTGTIKVAGNSAEGMGGNIALPVIAPKFFESGKHLIKLAINDQALNPPIEIYVAEKSS